MKISTRGRYGLRLAIFVAQNGSDRAVSLREASEQLGISVKYLEQLAGQLSRGGVFESVRGARGGYRLAREAEAITAGDVLRASEGSTAPVACLDEDEGFCPRRGECETIAFWAGLDRVIEEYVDGHSLAELALGAPGMTKFSFEQAL